MIDGLRNSVVNADLADWTTVTAYLLAAWLCFRASARAVLACEVRERLFWQSTAALLSFLGLDGLLDLQTLLTLIGRAHARANGWYEDRRHVQVLFVITLCIGTLIAGATVSWLVRRAPASERFALVGLALIALFVPLRAASSHHLNEIMRRGAASFNWGSLQELAGILIVAFSSMLYARERPKSR